MQFAVCVSPVYQTAVSFRSLASDLDSGDFSAVPDPDPSVTAVEELSVCSSTAGGFPWFKDSWRNRGSSSCSLVKRPRWSSTLQHWALVSRSSNPKTHRQTHIDRHTQSRKRLHFITSNTWVSLAFQPGWPGKLMVSSSLITKKTILIACEASVASHKTATSINPDISEAENSKKLQNAVLLRCNY